MWEKHVAECQAELKSALEDKQRLTGSLALAELEETIALIRYQELVAEQ